MGWLGALGFAPLGCQSLATGRSLRLANWGGAGDDSDYYRLIQSLYREFEARHGAQIRVEGTPGAGAQDYVRKLMLDHIAGTMPDVVTLDASSAAVFIDNGTLLDLTPFVERDGFDLGQFYPNVVDIARRGDRLYAVPTDFTPMVMYCNRRHFREAGLDAPDGRWTFDQFVAAAKALTREGRYGFEFANWMPGWVMFLWNHGADVLSPDGARASGHFDAPAAVEAVQFLADLVVRHKVAPDLSQAAAMGVDLFATGRASMKVVGHWYLVGLKASKDVAMEDVAVVELPTNLPKSVTVMYEAGNAIGRHCRQPELAWEYLKFWTSRSVQERYNSSGIAVCARRDVETAKTTGHADEAALAAAFQRIVPSARAPWGARVEGYDRVEDIGQKAMDAILKNGVPAQEALTKAARQIDEEFARR